MKKNYPETPLALSSRLQAKIYFEKRQSIFLITLLMILLLIIGAARNVSAQVNISSGGTVSQNFDAMSATATASLPTGWKADNPSTAQSVGSYAAAGTATTAIAGISMSSSAGNGIYNFGLGAAGAGTERAVGGLSSSGGSKSVNVYVDLLNNGASTISGFNISYNVEKYRNGTNAAGYRIQMYYSLNGTTWLTAGANFLTSFAADANSNGFTTVPGATVAVTSQSLAQSIAPGLHLYLAWNYSVSSGTTTTNAQALAVDDIVINATAAAPSITLSTNSLPNFGPVQTGNVSSEQTYTVSGSNLSDTLHLSAPADFEMSFSSGSGFTNSLFLLPSSGTVSSTTIYARFAPGSSGAKSDSLVHTSTGASTKKVGVSGTGTSCSPPTITPGGPLTFCSGGSVTLTADPGVSYLWSNAETTQSIVVTSSGSYSVTVTDGSSCSATSSPVTVTVNSFSYTGTIFSENIGTPSGTTTMASYTGWQNNGILQFTSTTAGPADVRITTVSNTYPNFSAGGNVFLGTAGGNDKNFIISGINTLGYSGITMSFGLLRNGTELIQVLASSDGVNYTPLTTSTQPASSTSVWGLVTVSSGIPAAANLRIKFEKSTTTQFRIDDISMAGTATAVSITASGPTTICNGSFVTLTSNIPNGNDWSFSPIFSFSQSVQANTNGDYFTIVSDINGCTLSSDTITVTVVSAPSVSTSVTDVLCSGDSTGTATAIPSGGAGTYSYSWSSNPVQTGVTATMLPAGTYTVTVTDIAGCSGTSTAIVGEPLPLQVSTSTTVPSSIGASDGTATATASDGTPGYNYSWNTAPVQNTSVATGLSAGTYDVIATDANGCTASASATIVDPVPDITVSTTAIGDFGTVVVGNSSAEDTYTVSGIYLSDTLHINAPTGFEISLTSGSGFGSVIHLLPSSGIVASTTVYVRFTPLAVGAAAGNITHTSAGAPQKDVAVSGTAIGCPQATITPSGPTSFCSGGSVTLTASSGATYLWSNGETTSSIVVTTTGSYSVVVTDAFACSSTAAAVAVNVSSFSVTGNLFVENMGTPSGNTFVNSYTGWQNNGIYTFSSTSTNQSDVRTSTASNYPGASGSGNVFMGTAGATNPRDFIIGGINTIGYTGMTFTFGMLRSATSENLAVSFSTDGINYTAITTTVQPSANTWAIVSDSIGAIPNTANLRIKFEKSSSVNFRIDDITIHGTVDTLIVLASSSTTICDGHPLILTSNIETGNTWSTGTDFNQSLYISTPGTYYNTVTDLNGCSKTSPSFTVSVNPSPAVDTLISTNLLCNNDSSGTIMATVSGGTTPYTYNYNSLPVQTTIDATGLKAGFYIFTVTDVNGCTASKGVLITQPTPLGISTSIISHPSFIGASDGQIASAVTGGTVPYTYSWDSSPVQTTDTASNLPAGIYTITVTDSNGCTISKTDTLFDPLPEITVSPSTLPAFPNTLVGNTSTEQTYTVSGINLTDSILIVAPAGFEISLTSGSGFNDSIALYPSSGTVSATTIYVHFVPVAGGTVTDIIAHTSVGATQKDVTVSGTGVTCAQATITPGGPTTFCVGGSVTLTASSGDTYLWSNGETTSSITTDTAGTFSVIVTDAFACSSTSAPVTVTVNTFHYNGAIFSENMGNSGGTVALATYTGWQNNGVYGFSTNPTGPSDVRTSSGSSTSYYPAASGGSNVFMGTAGSINPRDFIISGINTIGYDSLKISFGMLRSAITEDLIVEVSDGGTTYTALTTSAQPAASSSVWGYVTTSGTIPNTSNLYIKFRKTSNVSFRIDDVSLSGYAASPVISAMGPTAFCQGSQVKLVSNIPSGNLWSPGSEVTRSITVNASGTYGLTVTDPNGCVASASSVTVTVNPIPVVSTSVTDVLCFGESTGTATANVSIGTPPFTYSWNTSPVQTTQTATGLAAGTYQVVVTGMLGCKDSVTATISQPASPVSISCSVLTNVTCNGGSDGSVSVSGSGGTGAVNISGAASSGLTAGTYVYTATDANGCTATCSLTITEPAAIVVGGFTPSSGAVGSSVTITGSGFTGATDVQFNGTSSTYSVDNDGQITATVPAGATSGPITVYVGTCQASSAGSFTVASGGISLDLKLFLEGYYLGGGTMYSTLYDLEQGAVLTGPYSPDATDTIQVNLWSVASLSNPDPDYSEKVILTSNGTTSVSYPGAVAGDYYIAIKHKNTIETWSSNTVSLSSTAVLYNFSDSLSKAFDDGFNPPMQSMGGGVFAFYSGDVNQDGTVDGADMNDVYNDNNLFLYDYIVTDCSGDGTADGQDMNIVYNNNNLFLFYARPY